MIEHNLDELSQIAQMALLESLQTQAGVEAALENGAILVHLSGIQSIIARVLEVSETGGGCVAQVGIRVSGEAIFQEGLIDVIAGSNARPIWRCAARWTSGCASPSRRSARLSRRRASRFTG